MGYVKTRHPRTLKSNRRRECLKQYYRKREGRVFSYPAEQVQQHIKTLVDAGYSMQAIAVVAGCGDSTIAKIHDGQRQIVASYVANGIFQVGPTPVPAQAGFKVPSIGVVRRINALRRMGWTVAEIGKTAGRTENTAHNICSHGLKSVEYETWDDFRRAYAKLSVQRGPSKISAARSEREGWPSPWDWETATIDDPNSWPTDLKRVVRNNKRAEGVALLSAGLSRKAVAQRLDVAPRTVERWVAAEKRKASNG